jgi:hypothetical protein
MQKKIERIKESLKSIDPNMGEMDFICSFLGALEFPLSTIKKIQLSGKTPVSVGKKIIFHHTDNIDLISEYDIWKDENCLIDYILIFNERSILAVDTVNNDSIVFDKKDISKYLRFFFPIIGIKKDDSSDAKEVDQKSAELIAELHNSLLLNNEKLYENEKGKEDLQLFILRVVFIIYVYSFVDKDKQNLSLSEVFRIHLEADGSNSEIFFDEFFNYLCDMNYQFNTLPNELKSFPQLNISLYQDKVLLPKFNSDTKELLIEASQLDWRSINPDIFSSLMLEILSPEDIDGFNNNYTSTINITKALRPLFLEKLYSDVEKNKNNQSKLTELKGEIKALKIFDPALSSGSFIAVAYNELITVENLINYYSNEIKNEDYDKNVISPLQFFGIDNNKIKVLTAKISLSISYGKKTNNIQDTISIFDSLNLFCDNPLTCKWNSFFEKEDQIYIITSPTFKGAKKLSTSQKKDKENVFSGLQNIGDLDFVSCWFYLISNFIRDFGAKAIIISTNSVTQGVHVGDLWPLIYKNGVDIFYAKKSFKWKNSANNKSGVTVVIIGLEKDQLNSKKVIATSKGNLFPSNITPYLTPGNKTVVYKLNNNKRIHSMPPMRKGNMPYDSGYLSKISKVQADSIIDAYPSSKKFIKRIMGADEFLKSIDRYCLWIEDDDYELAMSIPPVADLVNKTSSYRNGLSTSGTDKLKEKPYQFRETNKTNTFSIIVPSVSSENYLYIPIDFIGPKEIATNLACVIYECDEWFFGVISSRMHNVWIRNICGALETRVRYSSTLGYNTFPFPDISNHMKTIIYSQVKEVLSVRENYCELPLSELYKKQKMPDRLKQAHYILDVTIESCFRTESFISDDERIEFLLKEYERQSKKK